MAKVGVQQGLQRRPREGRRETQGDRGAVSSIVHQGPGRDLAMWKAGRAAGEYMAVTSLHSGIQGNASFIQAQGRRQTIQGAVFTLFWSNSPLSREQQSPVIPCQPRVPFTLLQTKEGGMECGSTGGLQEALKAWVQSIPSTVQTRCGGTDL